MKGELNGQSMLWVSILLTAMNVCSVHMCACILWSRKSFSSNSDINNYWSEITEVAVDVVIMLWYEHICEVLC